MVFPQFQNADLKRTYLAMAELLCWLHELWSMDCDGRKGQVKASTYQNSKSKTILHPQRHIRDLCHCIGLEKYRGIDYPICPFNLLIWSLQKTELFGEGQWVIINLTM